MVLRVQMALLARGYDPGALDGVLGPKTRTALELYQRDSGIKVTGRLDQNTLLSLGITSP